MSDPEFFEESKSNVNFENSEDVDSDAAIIKEFAEYGCSTSSAGDKGLNNHDLMIIDNAGARKQEKKKKKTHLLSLVLDAPKKKNKQKGNENNKNEPEKNTKNAVQATENNGNLSSPAANGNEQDKKVVDEEDEVENIRRKYQGKTLTPKEEQELSKKPFKIEKTKERLRQDKLEEKERKRKEKEWERRKKAWSQEIKSKQVKK